eukprot:GEMP01036342.1.p1 GENE.GEMP01036342.1~~GEMP01036342.1.p1  ORF type:complete len:406 (-),score=77.13 GEMP01036342.1:785-2002(-)
MNFLPSGLIGNVSSLLGKADLIQSGVQNAKKSLGGVFGTPSEGPVAKNAQSVPGATPGTHSAPPFDAQDTAHVRAPSGAPAAGVPPPNIRPKAPSVLLNWQKGDGAMHCASTSGETCAKTQYCDGRTGLCQDELQDGEVQDLNRRLCFSRDDAMSKPCPPHTACNRAAIIGEELCVLRRKTYPVLKPTNPFPDAPELRTRGKARNPEVDFWNMLGSVAKARIAENSFGPPTKQGPYTGSDIWSFDPSAAEAQDPPASTEPGAERASDPLSGNPGAVTLTSALPYPLFDGYGARPSSASLDALGRGIVPMVPQPFGNLPNSLVVPNGAGYGINYTNPGASWDVQVTHADNNVMHMTPIIGASGTVAAGLTEIGIAALCVAMRTLCDAQSTGRKCAAAICVDSRSFL